MNSSNTYDLIIIGAGPAGISAAIYAARAKLKTLIIDSGESGGQIRITNEVVNYPGILSVSGAELSDTMRKQAANFGAKQIQAQISHIDFQGDWKKVNTDKGEFQCLGIIIATGARPRKAGFKGEEEYRGRGIGYCATCDGEFFTGLDVFVIGGGFAAAEEAVFLTRYARKVMVMVRGDKFTCSKSIAEKVMAHPKIEVKFNYEIIEANGDGVLKKAVFRNNKTNETYEYESPQGESFGIFIFAGYEPMSEFVKDSIELNQQGYILTNEDLETNIKGVYAAGDIRPKKLRQLVTAVSDGAVASTNLEKYIKEKRDDLNLEFKEEKAGDIQEKGEHSEALDEDLKNQLIPIFDRLEKDVYMEVSGIDGKAEKIELLNLAKDLVSLSKKLHVINNDTADEYPSINLLNSSKEAVGISYQAIGGHEFNSFVLGLYNTAGPGQNIDSSDMEEIKGINQKLNIQIGVTLSCTMCPNVVQGCQIAALNNPNISLEIIDISKNSDFRTKHNIMSVPAMVVNNSNITFGRKTLGDIIHYLKNI